MDNPHGEHSFISLPLQMSPLNAAVSLVAAALLFLLAQADDPYRFLTWNVTYGTIYPLGVPQQVASSSSSSSCFIVTPFFSWEWSKNGIFIGPAFVIVEIRE